MKNKINNNFPCFTPEFFLKRCGSYYTGGYFSTIVLIKINFQNKYFKSENLNLLQSKWNQNYFSG